MELFYTYEENRKAGKACQNLVGYKPDNRKLKKLGGKYFYDPNVTQLISCYANQITEGEDIDHIIEQYEQLIQIGKGKFGFAYLFNDGLVLKISDIRGTTEQHEFIAGKLANTFPTPNFVRTYGSITSNKLIEEGTTGKSKGRPIIRVKGSKGVQGGANYIMMEYINGTQMHVMVKQLFKENRFHDILVCFLQVFYTLWIAWHLNGFVHGDFHTENVMVMTMKTPVAIPYELPNGDIAVIVTKYVAKIIDLGFSAFTIKKPIPGLPIEKGEYVSPQLDGRISPFRDLYKFAGNFLGDCYYADADDYYSLFTIIFEYLGPIKMNWDADRRANKYEMAENEKKYYELNDATLERMDKTLSLKNYHYYLQSIVLDYFQAKYLFINDTDIPSVPWLECDPDTIKSLEKKGYKGMHACLTRQDVVNELDYDNVDIHTAAHSIRVGKPLPRKLMEQAADKEMRNLKRFGFSPSNTVLHKKNQKISDNLKFVQKYLNKTRK